MSPAISLSQAYCSHKTISRWSYTQPCTPRGQCMPRGLWMPRGFRMEKNKILVRDSQDTNQRNNFSESKLLHLPIHREALKSLPWDVWFHFVYVWLAVTFDVQLHGFLCFVFTFCFQQKLYVLGLPYLFGKVHQGYQSSRLSVQFSSVQSLSRVRLFATPWITERQASLSITNSRSSLRLMSIKSVGDAIQPSHPLLYPSPPVSNPSSIRVFSSESALLIRWPKYWSFSFSISPPNEHPGLISFRRDWLHLLAVQGTLKSLLQHHSSKASILRHSAFFTVQLSHPYMTAGKTIAFTRQTFVGKVMSLLLNTLSRLVITFLPRSKHLLISWLQSPSAVILEPQNIKSDTIPTVSPSICH